MKGKESDSLCLYEAAIVRYIWRERLYVTINEVSREVKIAWTTARKYLEMLTKKGVLEKKGRKFAISDWVVEEFSGSNAVLVENEYVCPHCKMDKRIRNPSGYCDHLKYPENCEVCKWIEENGKAS